jgi:hypothetical protein
MEDHTELTTIIDTTQGLPLEFHIPIEYLKEGYFIDWSSIIHMTKVKAHNTVGGFTRLVVKEDRSKSARNRLKEKLAKRKS